MLIFILQGKSSGGIKTHTEQLKQGLTGMGHQVRLFEVSFNPIYLFKNVLKVKKEIRRDKPDIIHFHGYRAMLYNLFLPKGYSAICTIHGFLELKSVASRLLKKIILTMAPKINMFICVSRDLQNYLIREFRIPLNKTIIIYNGVIVPSHRAKRADAPKIIGTCGRLVDIKGYHLLIRAFNKLKEKYHIQLHLIGHGPEMNKLMKLAQTDVYFHGYQRDSLLYMKHFHIFVQPSLVEGCGVAVLEAMSLNLPVIISDAGGLPELVEHNKNGLIFRKGDVEDLTNKLEMLITNPKLYQGIGLDNKEKVSQEFSFNKMLESTVKVYKDLMGDESHEQIV